MDDGELEISNQLLMSNSDMANSFDELLRNTRTCTHTHTCNPPGPTAATHTHTCYHTHTQVFSTSEGEREEELKKPRKPSGNREAVRKYREKKKAHAAYLEEEVKELRLINLQLMRKLQGQAALEAEVVRLRSLLVDLRAKIDGELGVYPFRKPCNGVGLQCNNDNPQCVGVDGELLGWDGGSCMPAIVDCQIDPNGDTRQNIDVVEAALEAEVARLRSLLVDLRAKIDGELGVYPFQKPCNGVGLQCNNDNPQCVGVDSELLGWDGGSCMPAIVDCQIDPNGDTRQNIDVVEAAKSMDAMGNLTKPASH